MRNRRITLDSKACKKTVAKHSFLTLSVRNVEVWKKNYLHFDIKVQGLKAYATKILVEKVEITKN